MDPEYLGRPLSFDRMTAGIGVENSTPRKLPLRWQRRGVLGARPGPNGDWCVSSARALGASAKLNRRYWMFPMILFASSTEKPRSVSLRTLPSEPAFRSAAVTASSVPSMISTMS